MKKKIVTIIIIIPVLLIFFIFIFVPIYNELNERDPQLSAYSDDWNGLSTLKNRIDKDYETQCLISSPLILTDYKDPEKTLLLIIGVEKKYDESEVLAIIDFVNNGGKVIIADDFGYANSFANRCNIEFLGKRLYEINYEGNTSFVKTQANMSIVNYNKTYNLTLDRPTALVTYSGEDVEQLITGNTYDWHEMNDQSWIDENDDGTIDYTERISEYGESTQISVIKYNDAGIVFIADPSIFINDMWDKSDNANFTLDLIDFLLPDGGKVIFDESRHTQRDLAGNLYKTIFELFVFSSRNIFVKIFFFAGMILVLGVVTIVVKEAKKLEHEFDPTYRKEVTLTIDKVKPDKVKKIFLNKLRMWYAMSDEKFKALDEHSLNKMIGDQQLIDFVKNPGAFKRDKLETIVDKISRWGK